MQHKSPQRLARTGPASEPTKGGDTNIQLSESLIRTVRQLARRCHFGSRSEAFGSRSEAFLRCTVLLPATSTSSLDHGEAPQAAASPPQQRKKRDLQHFAAARGFRCHLWPITTPPVTLTQLPAALPGPPQCASLPPPPCSHPPQPPACTASPGFSSGDCLPHRRSRLQGLFQASLAPGHRPASRRVRAAAAARAFPIRPAGGLHCPRPIPRGKGIQAGSGDQFPARAGLLRATQLAPRRPWYP